MISYSNPVEAYGLNNVFYLQQIFLFRQYTFILAQFVIGLGNGRVVVKYIIHKRLERLTA